MTGNNKTNSAKKAKILKTVKEYVVSFLLAILVALTIRHFVVEPFKIPSGSMIPTLLVGDFIFVNKFKYGFQIPFMAKRFVEFSNPKKGDVVVFISPEEPDKDFIKRVVAVAGDTIDYKDRTIYINDKPLHKTLSGSYSYKTSSYGVPIEIDGDLFIEDVTGKKHFALYTHKMKREGKFPYIPYKIPDGYFFVMGDNRDNSYDSRSWGLVPLDNLKGKALIVWFSINKFYDRVYDVVRWNRLFKVIK